ncbi:MAG TPA: hypothetical protein VE644_06995 [Gaiellaceae bacterium]|jgi:hypothetical protein|nr:hypothetical protein [Gaiellaceae bacterium]
MRRSLTARRSLVFLGVLVLLAAVPVAVLAGRGAFGGALERQSAKWTTTSVSTSSTAWRNVPGLSLTRCTVHQVSAMVSVTVRGAPVRFRVIIDGVPEAPMKPGSARFVPEGSESFSYTFVGRTAPFEADDTHVFNVQWRSPTGRRVTLQRGDLNLLFERGTQGCP